MQSQALIAPNPPAADLDRVQGIFQQIEQVIGFVPDAIRLYAVSPPLLESFVRNVGYFRQHPSLSGPLTAMIRYLVSFESDCRFCIDLNEGFLTNAGLDLDAIRASRNHIDAAPLPDRDKALLKVAVRSVADPEGITAADIALLRALDWTERDIFDAVAQAANNRALNFILKTFKVHEQGTFA